MKFSIVIPTCNRNDVLGKCLDCLHPNVQQSELFEYEIIVTDDSKENVAQSFIAANYSWVQWVEGPKRGPAANRNNGAKHARGAWIIFLDDDVLPNTNLLQEYKRGIEQNPDCLAFEGAIIPDNWELLKRDLAECPVNLEGGCFWSANIMIQKKLFYELNGFDEQFLIAAQEDQEFYIRLKKRVVKCIFLKQVVVIHPVRLVRLNQLLARYPSLLKNYILYVNKNYEVLGYSNKIFFLKLKAIEFLSGVKSAVIKWQVKKISYLTITFFYSIPIFLIKLNLNSTYSGSEK